LDHSEHCNLLHLSVRIYNFGFALV